VAALASEDPDIAEEQRRAAAQSVGRHLELAGDALEPPGTAELVLVTGVVGTGKSSVASELSERLDAVVISSDRVRKRLLGAESTERVSEAWGQGRVYTAEQKDRVYAALLDRARAVVASGRSAILDATYSRREHRDAVRRLARETGARSFAVEVSCNPDVARARLARRAATGTDPSDAGPEAYEPSVRGFEGLDEWSENDRAHVRTDADGWRQGLEVVSRRIRPG
jgi:predicted kinase